ncbi:hypothetical protein HFN_1185 [Helicobacter fennelliae MRY12-0050]|uniref:Uncharacterized protein n=1 Tax=Helicobacter fennelliae MRY12-0050 TaxID=1325130 RepID=T1D166_9HELI|nr:hypothetical protein HFN_1185 [Helicobacter fennelliae MRY12-0050]
MYIISKNNPTIFELKIAKDLSNKKANDNVACIRLHKTFKNFACRK